MLRMDGCRSFIGSSQVLLQSKGQWLFRDVSPRPTAADTPGAYLPQLTVYLGKRDFVDHIDLVDPVGESLQRPGRRRGKVGPIRPLLERVC